MADVESKSIPHEFPSSHWLKATGQCVLERYLSATMPIISSGEQNNHTFHSLFRTFGEVQRSQYYGVENGL